MPELDFRTLQTLPQRVKRLAQEHADRVAIRSIEHGAQTWREIFESSLRWGLCPSGCRGVARRCCRDHAPAVTGAAPCVARLRLAEGGGDHDQCPPQPCQRSSFDRSTRASV